MLEQKVMKALKAINEKEVIDLLVDMIRVDTTNPPGNELELAVLLADRMIGYGLETEIVPISENRANVIGILKGKGEKPSILYNGHLDVVPPGEVEWEYDPFEGKIYKDCIYGRGSADMKSGLAAMIVAVGALAKSGIELDGDIIIVGTADEEYNGIGAKSLVNSNYLTNVGAMVISEPTYNNLFIAEKGTLWLEITTYGKTAHGSMPELGLNAIMDMNLFLNELRKLKFSYKEHDLLGNPSLNIGTIKGGVKTNVVADRCVLTIDIRSIPGMDHEKIIEEIRKVFNNIREKSKNFNGDIKVLNDRVPIETNPNEALVKAAQKTAKSILNKELIPRGVNYFTDASIIVPNTKLPMIIYGPGAPELAHQPDEYVEIKKVIEAVKFFVTLPKFYYEN